jgi:hypothetical protein
MNKDLVQKIPLLTVNAGPRDGDKWIKRYVHIYIYISIILSSVLLRPINAVTPQIGRRIQLADQGRSLIVVN